MAFARVNVEFFMRPPNISGSIKSSSTQIFSAFSHSRAQNCIEMQKYRRSALVIAVFNIMRTLKFKPQPMVYVFRCRQSSKRISRETEAHFSRVKRSRLSVENLLIVDFDPVCFFFFWISMFVGCRHNFD